MMRAQSRFRSFVQSLTAILALSVSPGPLAAELLMDTGPTYGSGLEGVGNVYYCVVVQPFTLYVDATNVEVEAFLYPGAFPGVSAAKVSLTTCVGPGAAPADVMATQTVPGAPYSNLIWKDIMAVPSLSAGNYYLVMEPAAFDKSPSYMWGSSANGAGNANGDFGNAGRAVSIGGGTNYAFPPASNFTYYSGFTGRTRITGDVGPVWGPPTPGGGGVDFELDAGTVILTGSGEGVNDVSVTDLGAIHSIDAQSVAGSEAQTKSNEMSRIFRFSREDGLPDPTQAFILGGLQGTLAADNLGVASVDARVSVFDMGGGLIGADTLAYDVSPGLGFQEQIDVNEAFGFSALFVPGQQYELQSWISVYASSPPGGAGRALFADTMEVAVSGVPEPATLALLAVGGLLLVRRRPSM